MVEDNELRLAALEGDSKALGALIEKYRDFIYNLVWKMVLEPHDAEDITQDIIIKIITNLSKFRGESKFSTWVYRITYNHVINLPKRNTEQLILSFEQYGKNLDNCPDDIYPESNRSPTPEDEMIIKEAMLGCTSGMLLCLDREQRFIYILGDLFGLASKVGAEIVGVSPENFRQRLSRARKDLYNFMDSKCGLVNKSNPCRCRKKTKSFIKKGWVNPNNLKFNNHFRKEVKSINMERNDVIWNTMQKKYLEIYQGHPFQEKDIIKERIEIILASSEFKKIFDLN